MKKQKWIYRYVRSTGPVLKAKREISFEIKLSSRLLLDELSFNLNKQLLINAINHSIDTDNKEEFYKLSKTFQSYVK